MKTFQIGLAVVSAMFTQTISAASFPHKSAIYDTVTEGPMMKTSSKFYTYYDGDIDSAVSAEWRTQEVMGRKTHSLNISKKGQVFAVDLDRNSCTRTNVSTITDSITDPESFAKGMRNSMGLKQAGPCEGAGLKGTKFTSSFGEMCFYKEVFMLWTNAMGTRTTVTNVKFDTSLPQDKISIPSGIKCTEGPDLSRGLEGLQDYSNRSKSSSRSDDEVSGTSQPSPQEMDKAMEQAKDAMKMFGDMFDR